MQEKVNRYFKCLVVLETVLGALVLLSLVAILVWPEGSRWRWVVNTLPMSSVLLLIFLLVTFTREIRRYTLATMEDFHREQDELDAQNRDVLRNIAHDLRTPLTAIDGYAQGILDGVANTPDQIAKYVTTIRNKADDMSGLVDELSFFTHIYQKDLEYHWQVINARDYFSKCISKLSMDLEFHKISLVYRFQADEAVTIRIDPEKIKRVIHNIVGNASKYIRKEIGIVVVHIEETDTDLCIHIKDNGTGIEKEDLNRIFERFYRTDSSRNSKTGGSGLGLAIAKKIVEGHRGKIWAESEMGKETTISFSLPKVIQEEVYDEKGTDCRRRPGNSRAGETISGVE